MGKAAAQEEEGGHGDRPWVYFMVDAFFLMTEFYLIAFKPKVTEPVLAKRMPPGASIPSSRPSLQPKDTLNVHVSRQGGKATYRFMQRAGTIEDLKGWLQGATAGGRECIVKISYDPTCVWEDVMAVFNETTRAKIAEVGLIPLRGPQAAPGG